RGDEAFWKDLAYVPKRVWRVVLTRCSFGSVYGISRSFVD
ncbi:hypothetical protein LCGC14_2835580, partial [marine sediment metagenome]